MENFDITQHVGNWENFSCFLPGPQLRGREHDSFLWQVGSNAGGAIDDANWAVIYGKREEFGDDFFCDDIHSGLRGVRIYSVLVRVLDANGDVTPAASWVEDAINDLRDYPVLDDEVLSRIEGEEFFNIVKEAVHAINGRREDDGLEPYDESDETIYCVQSALEENGLYFQDGMCWPTEDQIAQAYAEIGTSDVGSAS